MSTPAQQLLEGYLRPEELASELGTSKRTLDRWQAERLGPPRTQCGRLILYKRSAVQQWLQERELRCGR